MWNRVVVVAAISQVRGYFSELVGVTIVQAS